MLEINCKHLMTDTHKHGNKCLCEDMVTLFPFISVMYSIKGAGGREQLRLLPQKRRQPSRLFSSLNFRAR